MYSKEVLEKALTVAKIKKNLGSVRVYDNEVLQTLREVSENDENALLVSEIIVALSSVGLGNFDATQEFIEKIAKEGRMKTIRDEYPPERLEKALQEVIKDSIEDETVYLTDEYNPNEQVVSIASYDEVYRYLVGRISQENLINRVRTSLLRKLDVKDHEIVKIHSFYTKEVDKKDGDMSIELYTVFHVTVEPTHP